MTAPVGSVTTPASAPVPADWATSGEAHKAHSRTATTSRKRGGREFIKVPPSSFFSHTAPIHHWRDAPAHGCDCMIYSPNQESKERQIFGGKGPWRPVSLWNNSRLDRFASIVRLPVYSGTASKSNCVSRRF